MHKATLLLLVAALSLGGCRKKAFPDPHFERATRTYQALFATYLDDCYAEPKMDEVLLDLKKVDEASSDAESAKALLRVIDEGKKKLAKDRADREKISLAAQAAAQAAPRIDVDRILAASAPPDAGPPPEAALAPDPYGPGASIADLNAKTGGCLVGDQPFTEQETNKKGMLYRLSSSPACLDKLPGFASQVVLVTDDGRIYRRIAASSVPEPARAAPRDAGTPQAPRAAQPAAAAQPARAVQAPVAEENTQTTQSRPGSPDSDGGYGY